MKIMKKNLLSVVLLAGLVIVLTGSANAQIGQSYRAQVPFDFKVGKLNLSAGSYSFETAGKYSDTNTLVIRNLSNGKAKFVRLGSPVELAEKDDVSKLIFRKYGERYFLAVIDAPTIKGAFARKSDERVMASLEKVETTVVALN
jgi:hypothetical protein